MTTEDHKTCIELTMKGIKKCIQDLESLQTLAQYFHSHPGLQARYSVLLKSPPEDREQSPSFRGGLYISKGASSKSYRKDPDLTVDNLINSISNWS